MAFKSYREHSKTDWGTDGKPNLEQIQAGAILRIADATEKMASNYVRMESDLAMYKRRYNDEKAVTARLQRSNNALRGHINRMKKQQTKP